MPRMALPILGSGMPRTGRLGRGWLVLVVRVLFVGAWIVLARTGGCIAWLLGVRRSRAVRNPFLRLM